MDRNNVYNLIILDESGSMSSIKRMIISSFNEVIQTAKTAQRAYPEQRHFISFVSFSGETIKTHLYMEPVDRIRELDGARYRPNNSTPLLDAIGMSCTKLSYDLPETEENVVLVTILTDGEENSSHEFTRSQINNMISKLKDRGWTFTYIGADHDVERAAMNISISNTITFNKTESGIREFMNKEVLSRNAFYKRVHEKRSVKDIKFYEEEPPTEGN